MLIYLRRFLIRFFFIMVVYAIAGTVIYSVNPKMVLEMAQSIWFITGPSLPIFLLVIAFITALLPRRG